MCGTLNFLQRFEFLDGALDGGSLGLSLALDHLGKSLRVPRYAEPVNGSAIAERPQKKRLTFLL